MGIELLALFLGLAGAVLIGLGVLMIIATTTRSRDERIEEEGRAYGVVIIGPLPILVKGRGSLVIALIIFSLIVVVIMAAAFLIAIHGYM